MVKGEKESKNETMTRLNSFDTISVWQQRELINQAKLKEHESLVSWLETVVKKVDRL